MGGTGGYAGFDIMGWDENWDHPLDIPLALKPPLPWAPPFMFILSKFPEEKFILEEKFSMVPLALTA